MEWICWNKELEIFLEESKDSGIFFECIDWNKKKLVKESLMVCVLVFDENNGDGVVKS